MILIYIPHHLCELYHQQGWTVTALRSHHGAYSMLASRPEPRLSKLMGGRL